MSRVNFEECEKAFNWPKKTHKNSTGNFFALGQMGHWGLHLCVHSDAVCCAFVPLYIEDEYLPEGLIHMQWMGHGMPSTVRTKVTNESRSLRSFAFFSSRVYEVERRQGLRLQVQLISAHVTQKHEKKKKRRRNDQCPYVLLALSALCLHSMW